MIDFLYTNLFHLESRSSDAKFLCMLLAARVLLCPSHRFLSPFPIVHISRQSRSMATIEALNAEIAQQSTLCQTLVKQNGDPSALEDAKKKLGELKKSLGVLTKAAGGGKDAKKKERLLLKTAKVCIIIDRLISKTLKILLYLSGDKGLWSWRNVL